MNSGGKAASRKTINSSATAAEHIEPTKLCTALLLLILFAGLSVQAAVLKMSLYHGGKILRDFELDREAPETK